MSLAITVCHVFSLAHVRRGASYSYKGKLFRLHFLYERRLYLDTVYAPSQQKRLAIALTLTHQPHLIFLADRTYSDPGTAQPLSGPAIKEHFAALFAGFPDATTETVALHAITADLAVWRWVIRGTNTGSYRGLPPTGRSLIQPGCEFIEVGGGKLQRVEGYFDRLGMLQQLGLVPAPGQAS